MANEKVKSIKVKFLETVENSEQYLMLFSTAEKVENELNKDLLNFDISEIMRLELDQNELELLDNYIDWSICEGIKENNVNPITLVTEEEE